MIDFIKKERAVVKAVNKNYSPNFLHMKVYYKSNFVIGNLNLIRGVYVSKN